MAALGRLFSVFTPMNLQMVFVTKGNLFYFGGNHEFFDLIFTFKILKRTHMLDFDPSSFSTDVSR